MFQKRSLHIPGWVIICTHELPLWEEAAKMSNQIQYVFICSGTEEQSVLTSALLDIGRFVGELKAQAPN